MKIFIVCAVITILFIGFRVVALQHEVNDMWRMIGAMERIKVRCDRQIAVMTPSGTATTVPVCQ